MHAPHPQHSAQPNAALVDAGAAAAPSASSVLNSPAPTSPASAAAATAQLPVLPPVSAFPALTEIDLSSSGGVTGGGSGLAIHIEQMQAACPNLKVLRLSGLGGFFGKGCYGLLGIHALFLVPA